MYNQEKRLIRLMLYSTTPPNDPNCLWVDTSVINAPVLKMFLGGAWVSIAGKGSVEISVLLEILTKIANAVETLDGKVSTIQKDVSDIEKMLAGDIYIDRTAHLSNVTVDINGWCTVDNLSVNEQGYIPIANVGVTEDGYLTENINNL